MNTFQTRIKEERERLGLNQADFGAIGGVKKLAQINYENGSRSPDAAYLTALAAAGVDVLYVLTGQRAVPVAPQALLPEGDRILLDNFHAAPPAVQAGVKTTLGAFSNASDKVSRKRSA